MEGLVINMKDLFAGIYQGKKVLVTGHTGFKGSWLCLWLEQMGAKVFGLSLDIPTEPSHFKLLNLATTSLMGDIRNLEFVQKTIDDINPDIIFHLAAQSLVLPSYADPVSTYATNVLGTVNLLEATRKNNKVKSFINVTSDKCYENREWDRGYREDDAMGGYDPYSSSKGCAELVFSAYQRSFFSLENFGVKHHTLLASVRAGNVIGGGDWAQSRLIPDIVRATKDKKIAYIRNPKATRPWQHVLEPLSGYLLLGQKLLQGEKELAEAFNFGPFSSQELSVVDVVERMQNFWDEIKYEIIVNPHQLHEAHLLKLDISKACLKLDWKPTWGDEQFEHTVKWYKDFYTQNKINSMQDLKFFTKKF